MELISNIVSTCPVCNKNRYYKSERTRKVNLDKPCRSCANSIKRGGTGVFTNKEGARLCKGCNNYFSLENYYKKHSTYCKTCSNIKTGLYIKQIHRYKKYSIGKEDYEKLLFEQQNSCAICKEKFSIDLQPRIDHNHSTGRVRGILCHNCNTGLGHFRDNIEILRTTIKYLENGSK